MVDSRAKGQRGEYAVRDMLREATGLKFERVPASGALEYLKGDLYVPNERNRFMIEVKNYEESAFNDTMFTAEKTNNINVWFRKAILQAKGGSQEPLLFFKYNRSKIFAITSTKPTISKYVYVSWLDAYCVIAEDWLKNEKPEFLK